MTTLHEYLGLKKQAHRALKQKARTPDYRPNELVARVTVEGRSGVRRIRIRDFQILTDSPPSFVGYDLGPSSPELALGALGSCLAHTWLIQAAAHDLPLDAVEVEVRGRVDLRTGEPGHEDIPPEPHGIAFTVNLLTEASQAAVDAVAAAVECTCPILNLLRRPQQVTARVNRIVAELEGAA
ncbi:OsmC family protein [Roseomonas sp. JC162]|uniref:OsmC family protein n=1 Tax=Neoroseomonas marina TaxID=1232220 RepID=A0A848EKL0_9PROT|nr:OsmC family protein [Neoroseomonas marina]NMJ44476.1 OsmC family protein [Neoroseomonas marina]